MPFAEQRRPGTRAVVGDREGEFLLTGDVGDELGQPGEERLTWIVGGGEFVATATQGSDLIGVNSDDQVTAGREMPIHGRVSHARAARDVVERRVNPAFGEDVLGGGQQEVPVALRVRTARPSPRLGHAVGATRNTAATRDLDVHRYVT